MKSRESFRFGHPNPGNVALGDFHHKSRRMSRHPWHRNRESLNGGSQRPLSAICSQSSTIVHFCGPFGPRAFLRGTFVANEDKCRQPWTIVDNYLKPPFAKPPSRLSHESVYISAVVKLEGKTINGTPGSQSDARIGSGSALPAISSTSGSPTSEEKNFTPHFCRMIVLSVVYVWFGWSRMSGRRTSGTRTSGTSRSSVGVQVLAVFSFIS